MSSPEYLICLNCETPIYEFEWKEDKVKEAFCQVCGNDDPEQFGTEEEFDALSGDDRGR